MVSRQDLSYAKWLNQIGTKTNLYYSYCVPWMSIGCSLFALGVLFFRKRTEENLIILIFKWQYFIGVIYALNMVFNDNTFSLSLFKYVSTQNVADIVCKLHLVLMKYIYCMAPWMQVVITFDRLWSVVFANKWKVKRTTKTLSLLIVAVQGVVFLINLFYVTYYARASVSTLTQFDPVLNKSIKVNATSLQCTTISKAIQTAQDMIHVIMRIVLPLIIMIVCNVILIKHIREAKKKIIRERDQKRENYFTRAIAFVNSTFFVFNLPITVYYIYYYYLTYSDNKLSFVGGFQFNLFFIVAYLFSYMFTLCQFWIDLALNRIFRKEIFAVLLLIVPRRFNRVFSQSQTQTQTQARGQTTTQTQTQNQIQDNVNNTGKK